MELKTAREKYNEGKIDTEVDQVFIRHLVKNVQKVDPDIGAYIFPETKQVVFFWRNIIIYKVWLNEENIDTITIEEHKKKVQTTITAIKMGLINIKPFQKEVKDFNKHKTGKQI